ncbi:synaptojanin-2-binding protein-like [Rhinophrynus dorsalis]
MSAGSRVAVEDIALARGPSGLGFNIIGGTDQQYLAHDSGIYVSSIKENGAAAVDGRLQEGDRILEVNGIKLENLLHNDAVDLFRNAGENVVLKVQHKFQNQQNGPSSSKSEKDSEGSSLSMFVVSAVVIAAVAVFVLVKYRHRSSRF